MAEEKNFERKVKGFLEDQGCWFLKTWSNGVQRSGVPDLLVCCNGYFVGVELKAHDGKPSALQLWNLEKIERAGGFAILLYPAEYELFQGFIDALCAGYEGNASIFYQELKGEKF